MRVTAMPEPRWACLAGQVSRDCRLTWWWSRTRVWFGRGLRRRCTVLQVGHEVALVPLAVLSGTEARCARRTHGGPALRRCATTSPPEAASPSTRRAEFRGVDELNALTKATATAGRPRARLSPATARRGRAAPLTAQTQIRE